MFPQHVKICILLTSFTLFWSWQIAQPVLDSRLPSIRMGLTNSSLPISEVLSQYMGAATLLTAYTLYSTVSHGALSFKMNLAFVLASFMIASGHGVHMASVTIQKQMSRNHPIYALVYFLHEHWSHNMFLVGFYSLVFLLIWAERNCTLRKLAQDTCTKANENVSKCSPQNIGQCTTYSCACTSRCQSTVHSNGDYRPDTRVKVCSNLQLSSRTHQAQMFVKHCHDFFNYYKHY